MFAQTAVTKCHSTCLLLVYFDRTFHLKGMYTYGHWLTDMELVELVCTIKMGKFLDFLKLHLIMLHVLIFIAVVYLLS